MCRFSKLALSGLTALSLSLAPMPAVSAPDGEDVAKALAGLAVLGLIVSATNSRSKSKSSSKPKIKAASPYGSIEGSRVIDGEIRRPNLSPRDEGVRRVALPDRCVRIVSTSRGDRTVYGARCLQRDYIYANQLPADCRLRIRTNNRVRDAYGARCLRRDGWQVARF